MHHEVFEYQGKHSKSSSRSCQEKALASRGQLWLKNSLHSDSSSQNLILQNSAKMIKQFLLAATIVALTFCELYSFTSGNFLKN